MPACSLQSSAAVVALALVAQATDFGPNFRAFALLLAALGTLLLAGVIPYRRVSQMSREHRSRFPPPVPSERMDQG